MTNKTEDNWHKFVMDNTTKYSYNNRKLECPSGVFIIKDKGVSKERVFYNYGYNEGKIKGIQEGKEMIPTNIWEAFKEGHKKGRQEMRDEIREWFEKHQTVNGMIEFYTIQFEEKFGSDKK